MAADFCGGVLTALADYLRAEMPSVQQVLTEWPPANVQLDMPSLTITTANEAKLTPVTPNLRSIGTPAQNAALNQYIVGDYELTIQIDLWARNKPERQRIQQEFFNAIFKPVDPPGLHLVLTDYFDVICTYWPEGYRNIGNEASAQRQEWRSTFDMSVMAAAIRDRTDYIISTPAIILETPDEIEQGV